MARRYELSEARRAAIKDILPGKASDIGRTAKDNRQFVNACLWIIRSGAHWENLPERYGLKWKTAHARFTRWAKKGVWDKVFAPLLQDKKNKYIMIDSTIIRAHQQSEAGKGGGAIRLWGDPVED